MREMKASGIEWIGEIPKEWDVCLVKRNYDIVLGKMLQPAAKSESDELCQYLCAANISWNGIDTSIEKKMWFSPKEKEIYKLIDGDLLVTEGGDVAVSSIWHDEITDCFFQNALHRTRGKGENTNRYLFYWLQVLKNTGYIDLICNKATLAHFTKEKLGDCPIPYIDGQLQLKIADYLDKKCAEIDALIAAKEKTNALLKERRQSIIYEAVTKGLDPNAPMKDSGIEWIGMIPEGWRKNRIKNVAEFFNGDRSSNYPSGNDLMDEGIIFLTSNNIHDKYVEADSTSKYISEEKYSSLGGAKININDIIFCLRGSVGTCAINKCFSKGTVASSLVAIRPNGINPDFLNYLLSSRLVENQTNENSNGTCAANLSAENVAGYVFLEPPIDEQKVIVDYLDKKCAEIDAVVNANESTIEKLKEYRQSVIYEAVTGKVEV